MNKTIHCKTCAGAFDSINVKADAFCKCKYCGVENYIDAKYNVFLNKPTFTEMELIRECFKYDAYSKESQDAYRVLKEYRRKKPQPVIIQTTQPVKNLDEPKNNIKVSLKYAISAFVVFDIINNFCRKK